MMASNKVIRAVTLFGGPGGLFTAVASSSTEYGCLFAEYQDVAKHKEELGKHQLTMTASMKRWPYLAAQAASTQQSPHSQQSTDPSLLSIKM